MNINWELISEEGLIITVVGYLIVFSALVMLYLMFTWMARAVNGMARRRLRREGKHKQALRKDLAIPGDHSAAIAMALYIYNELHDEESHILTIKRIDKQYSPWSSRIYNMRKYNRR